MKRILAPMTPALLAAGAILILSRLFSPPVAFGLSLAITLLASLGLLWWETRVQDPLDVDSTLDTDQLTADPWDMQRLLMEASDQLLPLAPEINNASVLYAALIMEESAETFAGMAKALARSTKATGNTLRHEPMRTNLPPGDIVGIEAAAQLQHVSLYLEQVSKVIRMIVADKSFAFRLTDDEAEEIFDGTTDVTVVNCGLALSSGLDGAAGYEEVAGSNLSKRNPDTGRIDKDAGGKWIKGRDFRKPDLLAVLRRTARQRGLA